MNETNVLTEGGREPLEQAVAGELPAELPDARADIRLDTPFQPAAGDPAGVRPQRTVPYGALAEERARRKELQRELQGAIEAQRRLQGRLDLLHELAQQGDAPNAEGGTDRAVDPGEQMVQAASEHPSPIADVEAEAAFRTQVMQSVREVMQERPDFLAAYQHARQARVSELRALGYAPQEALEITFENELEIIQNAYAKGRNPAEIIYDYARRHGYGGGISDSMSGKVPPLARPGGMSEAEKVALAARGQAASKSLSAAGGGPSGTLTLEALASMSDEEFAEATKGDRWQKLLRN